MITRTVYEPYKAPTITTEIEARRKVIAEKERTENLKRYRELVFLYADRPLNDDEVVEIAELCQKLALPSASPDEHRRAIRDAKKLRETLAEPDPDLESLDKAAQAANAAAVSALAASIGDFFIEQSIEQIEYAKRQIFQNCPWLQRRHLPGSPTLPDRKCGELVSAASTAQAARDSAKCRKPNAEASLAALHRENEILWPRK
jgi:hypothetical protein